MAEPSAGLPSERSGCSGLQKERGDKESMVGSIVAATSTKSLFSTNNYCFNPPIGNKVSNGKSISMVPQAKNREEEDDDDGGKLNLSSSKLIIQSAISLFAFGFVDAGYSEDWSRIGAISKETEEVCKNLSFVVVPFSIFLVYTLSAKGKEE